eukprot:TRINITY_DN5044_c0_g1_i2.p1 TRINITY_DN5044_c0_g1~~TRINITY_DN5044_c0_g1_i2.p1  ORF type:complete len:423 (-),score=106.47 TRINITY_DN5044_c0_g1_i2:269-1537(-)
MSTRRSAKRKIETAAEENSDSVQLTLTAKGTLSRPKTAATVASPFDAAAWKEIESCVVRDGGVSPSAIVYGFDMDDTLISTASGAKFAKSASDWKLWDSSVPSKLQSLHASGAKIVIFTNQGGVAKGHTKINDLKTKIDAIIAQVAVPMQVFIATADDLYRKPSTNMWDLMAKKFNGSLTLDLAKCVYVGDAAGRAQGWMSGKKKDFSCSDRKFAHNVGVGFQTPEEFFLGQSAAPFSWGSIDPNSVKADQPLFTPAHPPLVSDNLEVILLVGRPASGKSTFSRRHLVPHGYVHVNRDTLKTKEKCWKVCEEALKEGKKVVIDNTNPDAATRKEYIELAAKFKAPIRCFVMQTSQDLADHLNLYRERITNGESPHVPSIAVNRFKSSFKEPTLSEGFSEIKQINFVPNFDSDTDRQVFLQYT